MDNREAMIKGLLSPHFLNDSHHYITKEYPRKEVFKHGLSKGFDIGWQAATAHNRDAVIDKCVNDVTQILQLISIYYAEKLPTYDARAGLSVICSNYPESLRNKLRALKTNKEG